MTPKNDLCTLMPWYIKGTLDEQETHAMNEHIKACDECASEFNVFMQFSRVMQEPPKGVEDLQGQERFGFNQLQRNIMQKSGSPLQRLIDPLCYKMTYLWQNFQWFYSGIAGAALALVITLNLPQETQELGDSHFVLLSGLPETSGPTIQLIFNSNASEKQVRDLLLEYHLLPIGQPTATGVYRLNLMNDSNIEMQLKEIVSQSQVSWASME